MKIDFVPFDEKLLELSWNWFSDDELRNLAGAAKLTKEEQLQWYDSLSNRVDYLIWGITVDNRPIGAAGLKRIVNQTAHVFWYIGEKNFWGKGIGLSIANKVTETAKEQNIKVLYGEPKIENYRSINLLFKVGYKIHSYNNDEGFYLVKKEL